MAEIIHQSSLKLLRAEYAQKSIVFTNGCFDLLHLGHHFSIQESKKLGDILVVGVNTDASIRKIKGIHRPIENLEMRLQKLALVKEIDFLVSFEEETPLALIKDLQPNVLTKGGDYSIETVVGAKEVQDRGGQVVIIPHLPGYSTTSQILKGKTNK